MKLHNFSNCDEDVSGSQSQLCDRLRETGSGSLFCDTGTETAPAASFEVVAGSFESID
jgi:hypothetical protein